MSHLKSKSEINMEAAEVLFKKSLYPSCCHPAYYSCLQLMKYTIKEKIKISYDKQEAEIRTINASNKRFSRFGSHNYLIDKIVDKLTELDRNEAKKFKRHIEDLKNSREEADYKNVCIIYDDSEKAIRIAKEINSQLHKVFKV